MVRLLAGLIIAATCGGALTIAQQNTAFPHTSRNGRATPEYSFGGVHVVANYDYSQRNHASAWLLLDIAMASRQRFVLHKSHVKVVTPNGTSVPVASQSAIIDDSGAITQLLQNAKIHRQPLLSYFSQRGAVDQVRFQSFPIGGGTASDEAVVDDDRVTTGGVLFRNPDGKWPEGTYRLEVTNDVAKAALPIVLQ
jgi:hypothetical protein